RDGAPEMRALPVKGEQPPGGARTEDIALGAGIVRQPKLPGRDARRGVPWGRDLGLRDDDGPPEAGGLAEIEEAKERGNERPEREREPGKCAHSHERATRDFARLHLACACDLARPGGRPRLSLWFGAHCHDFLLSSTRGRKDRGQEQADNRTRLAARPPMR